MERDRQTGATTGIAANLCMDDWTNAQIYQTRTKLYDRLTALQQAVFFSLNLYGCLNALRCVAGGTPTKKGDSIGRFLSCTVKYYITRKCSSVDHLQGLVAPLPYT